MHSLTPRIGAHVYRVYSDDRLIYIGHSTQLFKRLDRHRFSSWWAASVTRVHASTFPTVAEAKRAEKQAIVAERPRWNRYERRWQLLTTLAWDELNDYAICTLNHVWFRNAQNMGGKRGFRGHGGCCESSSTSPRRTLSALRAEAASRFNAELDLSPHEEFASVGYQPLAPWPPLHLRVPAGAA